MMAGSTNKILSLESLDIGFISGKRRRSLLPPVSASARKGEMVAVIGRNGIGKSTLLRTIMGLQPSLGGKVLIGSKEISGYSKQELAQKAGYISTEIVRASNMRVYDLVALGRYPYTSWIGTIDEADELAISEALGRTGMNEFSGRYISELSDGERQRAMIARVLAQETEILVMDEPTAFLDIAGKYEMVHLLSGLAREGRTIVFSTHDFNIALSQADKIWLILDDRMVEGSPEDLMLSGAFEHLFDSRIIGFSSKDGSFSMRPVSFGKICVKGEGIIKAWTSKAIERAGYSVTDGESMPCIKTPSYLPGKWVLAWNDNSTEFESIYDLAGWLVKNGTVFI